MGKNKFKHFETNFQFESEMNRGLAKLNITLAGISKFANEIGKPVNLEYIDDAVGELAAMDNPRIFVIISGSTAQLACFFHKHGLYGPDVVLLWHGNGYFNANDNPRVPNCTQSMLAEVLKSIIFFSDGSDFAMGKPVKDSLGLYPFEYDEYLKANLERPEEDWKWFFWRRFCYSPIEATAHVIQKVDERLGLVNDTIGNWMANSDNYRRNASFIENIFKEELGQFEYEGLRTNTLMGPAGFFQILEDKNMNLKPVPVAAYYPDTQKYEVIKPVKWQTLNGQPPLDRIHYNHIRQNLVPKHSLGILLGMKWNKNDFFFFILLFI